MTKKTVETTRLIETMSEALERMLNEKGIEVSIVSLELFEQWGGRDNDMEKDHVMAEEGLTLAGYVERVMYVAAAFNSGFDERINYLAEAVIKAEKKFGDAVRRGASKDEAGEDANGVLWDYLAESDVAVPVDGWFRDQVVITDEGIQVHIHHIFETFTAEDFRAGFDRLAGAIREGARSNRILIDEAEIMPFLEAVAEEAVEKGL